MFGEVSITSATRTRKEIERPDLLTYTLVYGYRPEAWRTDYPRWDWRIFGELTGEHSDLLERQTIQIPGTAADQVFLGPSRARGLPGHWN